MSGENHEAVLKTNLLYDAAASMNLGAEVGLSRLFSIEVSGVWNPWTFKDGMKYKHWLVQPELRLWPRCPMGGLFVGLHALGGEYNLDRVSLLYGAYPDLRDYRFQGWGAGAGAAIGYRYDTHRHWAVELEAGLGWIHSKYGKYTCGNCGEKVGQGTHNYVGPTKVAVNLVYRFGKSDRKDASEAQKIEKETQAIAAVVPVGRDTIIKIVRDTVVKVVHDTIDMRRKTRQADFTLRLQYPLDSSVISPSLGDNRRQLDKLEEFLERYADNPDVRIHSVEILGYASLEGDASHNLALSQRRAESLARAVMQMQPKLRTLVRWYGDGEDWDNVDFHGKEALMRIYDLNERERELRKMDNGNLFRRLLEEQLPTDRRTICVINYTIEE